jgi:tetratricopeptide (TPR) repeat protein
METVIYSSEFTNIEYFRNDETQNSAIAFIFTLFGNKMLEGNPQVGKAFLRNGFDVIAFKIANDDLFQSVPPSVFETIKSVTADNQYDMKVGYGASIGASASIAFSKLLDLDMAIAISPVLPIGKPPFDEQWLLKNRRIKLVYQITEDTVSPYCKFQMLYDDKTVDRSHIEVLVKILPTENVELYKLPYAGHGAVNYLNGTKLIDEIIKECRKGSLRGLNLRKEKNRSNEYLQNLSAALISSRKFRISLSIIDSAIALNGSDIRSHITRSKILKKLRRVEESIESLNIALSLIDSAIALEGSKAVHHRSRSKVLKKLNRIDESIESLRIAHSLDPESVSSQEAFIRQAVTRTAKNTKTNTGQEDRRQQS